MRFTVVISTYNRVNLLKKAIDSARNQTIECEVVVADDCSTDETETFVKSLGNEIVYHRNPVNMGHAATVNAGVTKASGDWIKFLDDDDYLAPNCLEEIAKAVSLHPDTAICSCLASQVDSQGVELSRTPKAGPGLAYYIPQADIHYGMLLELLPFGTPVQVACNKEAFIKTGGWDSSLDTNCDDVDSWINIARFGDAIFLNQCLAYRTIWPGAYNYKFSFSKRLETNILMKEKIYSLVHEQHRDEIPQLEDIKKYLTLHWSLVALKHRQIKSFLSILNTAIFSPTAWKLLLDAYLYRFFQQVNNSRLRKVVLIDN